MPINRAAGGAPVGAVEFFAMNAAPAGWLKANGATLTRAAYPALWEKVNPAAGGAGGVGNGSTTFTVPDLRGEFPRGWDDGRAVDSGRGFGSAQTSAFGSHTHIQNAFTAGGSQSRTSSSSAAAGEAATMTATAATGSTANSSETRPRNVALLACIKF